MIALGTAGLCSVALAQAPSAPRLARLWRSKPKRILMQVQAPDWCGRQGPCTTSYLDYQRVSSASCLLLLSDGRYRYEYGLWDESGTNARSVEGRFTLAELSGFLAVLDRTRIDPVLAPARNQPATPLPPGRVPKTPQFDIEATRLDGTLLRGIFTSKRAWRRVSPGLGPLVTWWDQTSRRLRPSLGDAGINNCTAVASGR